MTTTGNSETLSGDELDPQRVVEYLRGQPAFFAQHPELLSELSLPHDSGTAVSLVERQVSGLRADNARLKQQLDRLLTTARQNERLNSNIHALALRLINAVGPQAIFSCLEQCLGDDFDADYVAARIFADAAIIDNAGVEQFVGAETKAREVFLPLLENQVTSCGQLSDAHHEVLFNAVSGRLSAVIMPLIGKNWDGVLVIASSDSDRYQADMGTEFLTYLKDVVALVIDPWVRRERQS